MKKILLVIFFLTSMFCFATEPYSDQITISPDKEITARLTTSRGSDVAIVIEDINGKKIKEFTYKEILEDDDIGQYNYGTAGNNWYQNSISFITRKDKFFVVRTRWGKTITIDLTTKALLQNIPSKTSAEIQETLTRHALELLNAPEPESRQTGAIACGQLQLNKAIPGLKKLLGDENYYTTNIPKEWTRVYYIRKAAKEALDQLGEKTANIIIEEPDK